MTFHFKANRRLALTSIAMAAMVVIATPALSQTAWPSKPVRIVVPFAPGGTTDILARAVAPELSKAFGQQFVVYNRAGAGGNVGADIVAKSPADGYTLLMGTVGTHGINKSLYAKMPFDPQKDFAPVTLVAGVPNVMVMNAEKAAKEWEHTSRLGERMEINREDGGVYVPLGVQSDVAWALREGLEGVGERALDVLREAIAAL